MSIDSASLVVAAPSHAVEEIAAAANVSRPIAQLIYRACRRLRGGQLKILETMVELVEQGMPASRLDALGQGLARVIEDLPLEHEASVLDSVDGPIDQADEAAALIWAGSEEELNRNDLLAQSVSIAKACDLAGRSRQQIEAYRRAGRLIGLKAGGRWRYPLWQFSRDSETGLLPGLSETIKHLHLSPAGAAFWLTRPCPELADETPIEALRGRRQAAVLELAEQLGHLA